MSGLPTTLQGMAGFMIFVVFILVLTVPNLHNDDATSITTAQTDFQAKLNSTTNSSTNPTAPSGFWSFLGSALGINGIYDFIIGFFQVLISFFMLILTYLGIFVGVSSSLPSIFFVIFAIMASSVIIGIIKLIALSGE